MMLYKLFKHFIFLRRKHKYKHKQNLNLTKFPLKRFDNLFGKQKKSHSQYLSLWLTVLSGEKKNEQQKIFFSENNKNNFLSVSVYLFLSVYVSFCLFASFCLFCLFCLFLLAPSVSVCFCLFLSFYIFLFVFVYSCVFLFGSNLSP